MGRRRFLQDKKLNAVRFIAPNDFEDIYENLGLANIINIFNDYPISSKSYSYAVQSYKDAMGEIQNYSYVDTSDITRPTYMYKDKLIHRLPNINATFYVYETINNVETSLTIQEDDGFQKGRKWVTFTEGSTNRYVIVCNASICYIPMDCVWLFTANMDNITVENYYIKSNINDNIVKTFYNTVNYIYLKEGLKIISDKAFENCVNLKGDLIIPEQIEYIGYSAFNNCTGLNGVLEYHHDFSIHNRCFATTGNYTVSTTNFTNIKISGKTLLPIPSNKYSGRIFPSVKNFSDYYLEQPTEDNYYYVIDGVLYYSNKNDENAIEKFTYAILVDFNNLSETSFDFEQNEPELTHINDGSLYNSNKSNKLIVISWTDKLRYIGDYLLLGSGYSKVVTKIGHKYNFENIETIKSHFIYSTNGNNLFFGDITLNKITSIDTGIAMNYWLRCCSNCKIDNDVYLSEGGCIYKKNNNNRYYNFIANTPTEILNLNKDTKVCYGYYCKKNINFNYGLLYLNNSDSIYGDSYFNIFLLPDTILSIQSSAPHEGGDSRIPKDRYFQFIDINKNIVNKNINGNYSSEDGNIYSDNKLLALRSTIKIINYNTELDKITTRYNNKIEIKEGIIQDVNISSFCTYTVNGWIIFPKSFEKILNLNTYGWRSAASSILRLDIRRIKPFDLSASNNDIKLSANSNRTLHVPVNADGYDGNTSNTTSYLYKNSAWRKLNIFGGGIFYDLIYLNGQCIYYNSELKFILKSSDTIGFNANEGTYSKTYNLEYSYDGGVNYGSYIEYDCITDENGNYSLWIQNGIYDIFIKENDEYIKKYSDIEFKIDNSNGLEQTEAGYTLIKDIN